MTALSVLKNHMDISIQGKSGVVSASNQAENFFLSVSKEDVLNYARSGNDLVIEFKGGQKLKIEGFFAYGLGFHNLIIIDEGEWLVNFTQALSGQDDGINDANVYYEELKHNDSVKALLGILAGAGGAAGIGAALSRNDDVPERRSEKPATPSVSTVMDKTGPVTGPIKSGDVTDETQPVLSGKGTLGNDIIIRDGDDIIGKVIVDEDGNWNWKPDTPLGEGDHSLTVSEKDKAANESERSDSLDFTVDTTAPGALDESRMHLVDDFGPVTGEIARGGVTDDKTPTYSSEAGSVDPQDVDHIDIYHTDRDGHKVYLGRAAVQADGSWSFDPNPPLSPGDYVLSARPVDKAGNEGPETSGWNFRILGDAPSQPSLDEVYDNFDPVVGKVEKGSVTNDTTPVVKGTGTAGSIITVYVTGPDGAQFVAGTTTVKSDGTWSIELTTPLGAAGDGEYVIQARAGDAAGQTSAMTGGHPVILDTTAPDAPSRPVVVDRVGDVTGPVVPGGTTDDKQPAFRGQVHADEAGSTVIIYDNGRKIGEAAIGEDGSWSWTPPAPGLVDGQHSITTTVTDRAGNVSAPSDRLDFTLDTSQVGISFSHFEDDYGPITANISSGGATDDRRPALVGLASENATVEVSYVDSHGQRIVFGVTSADSQGNWKLIPGVDLADGYYEFTATATNSAGNKSQTGFELEIDGTAPAAPVLDKVIDDVGLVQGPISSGETTDDPTPTFHGRSGEPGTTITIRDQDGRVLGTTTVRPDGTWVITTDALSEGSNQLTITATDKVGNVSDETHFEVILDTQAPTVSASLAAISDDTGTSSSDFITGDNTLIYTIRVNGSLEAGDTVWLRIVDSNGRAGSWMRAVANGDGTWTVDRNSDDHRLADGNYTIETVVRDAAGNEGPVSKQAVVVDTEGPLNGTVVITSYYDDSEPNTGDFGSGSSTNDRSPLLKGTASGLEAIDIITIYQNGVRIGTTTVDANGNWSYQLDGLGDGKYIYKAVVTGAAGNEGAGSAEFDFTVGTTAPDKPSAADAMDNTGLVTGPIKSGDVTDETRPELSGKGEPGSEIIIRDGDTVIGSAIVDKAGNWSWKPDTPLGEGDHSLSVSAKDNAGNESDRSDPLDFTIDTTAPTLSASLEAISDDTGNSSNDFITSDNTLIYTIRVNGTADTRDTVWLRIVDANGRAGAWIQAVANGDGTWTVDRNSDAYKLADGNYTIETVVRDAAGNESPVSKQAVVIDTEGPLNGDVHITSYFDDTDPQTGDFGSGSFTNDRSPLLKGTASGLETGDIITVYQDGVRIGTTSVDANGNWSCQLDGLSDGRHVYRAVITDAAGNEGKSSAEFDFTVDTIAPVANSAIIGITDDTGLSSTDFITRDHTLIISAKVDQVLTEHERVQISVDGGVVWRDAVFNAETNTWDLDYRNTYLANGTYTFKSRVVDVAGNWHGVDTKTVIIDDVQPSTVTQITHFSDDYGLNKYPSLPSGSYTDDTTPTLHGTISAQLTNNAVIAVYRGTKLIGYANVVGKNWSLTDTTGDLRDGHFYTYTAVVQSGAGVDGVPSREFEIGIDSTDSNMAPQVGMGGAYATYSTALRLGVNGGWVMMTDMAEFSADGRDFRDFGKPNLLSWGNLGNAGISNLYPREKLFSSYTYGDYNRDGYMDMFLTDRSYTGPTGTMFVGQADGRYKATFVFTDTLIHFGSTISIDMDGDGWLDVILGDSGTDSSTFLHNKAGAGNGDMYRGQWDLYGRGSGSAARDPLYGLFIDHELSAVDLNNDGAVDFVGHAYQGGSTPANVYDMTVLYNNGTTSATGANWSFGQTFKNVFNTSGYLPSGDTYEGTISLTWADLNGDGYMDLFIGQARNGSTQTSDSVIFYNDGTGKLKSGQRIADGMGGKSTLAIDWDGDGHMDIVEVPEAQYSLGMSKYYHNTGRVDANGQVIWDIKSVKDMGVATAGGSHINLDLARNGASAVAIDYDWDGDQDLLVSRADVNEASVVVSNPDTPAYGTAMHLRILNPDGTNTLYSNTVQLFDSKGRLVSSQILNPQYGTGWNDSSAIVHFYGLKESETYTAVLLRNIKGVSSNVGGFAMVGGKFTPYVNESWTGLKATESYNGYVLTAESGTNTSNTNYAPGAQGIVGTGYNDTFFATKGTHTYNGGGGWVVGDGDRYWDVNSGIDILDFKLAGTQGVIVDLGLTGYQNTGFGTVRLINIEGIYGAGGNDTFTAGTGTNIFNGRGGDDIYNLAKGGHNTLLFETIDQKDATGGNGHDTVNGFDVADFNGSASSDRIDLADLLIGYKASADGAARYINGAAVINDGDNIIDYLSVCYEGNNTVLYLDRDGQGDAFESTALLTIMDMQVDLATLLANHQIVV